MELCTRRDEVDLTYRAEYELAKQASDVRSGQVLDSTKAQDQGGAVVHRSDWTIVEHKEVRQVPRCTGRVRVRAPEACGRRMTRCLVLVGKKMIGSNRELEEFEWTRPRSARGANALRRAHAHPSE